MDTEESSTGEDDPDSEDKHGIGVRDGKLDKDNASLTDARKIIDKLNMTNKLHQEHVIKCDQKLNEAEEKYEKLIDKYRKCKESIKIGIRSTDRYECEMKALKKQVKSKKMPSNYFNREAKKKE